MQEVTALKPTKRDPGRLMIVVDGKVAATLPVPRIMDLDIQVGQVWTPALEAHVEEVSRTLEKGGPCGRRLDFLMQELNREANTLSSKSISSSTTQNAVELKVLIEQMREQIQNIE